MFDAPVSVDHLRDLDDEPWQSVSPRYASQLRLYLLFWGLILALVPWLLGFVGGSLAPFGPALPSAIIALLFLALIVLWVPRRVRHTRYLLRELDLHMQTGLWWRRTVSVAISRVQHLEITQGPLERSLGLSRLAVYTAGGMKSDLMIPGLPAGTAGRLKVQILSAAEREDSGNAGN